MTTSRDKPLAKWTDDELAESVTANAPHVVYSINDLVREQERREGRTVRNLATAAAIASAIAAVASAVAAIVSLGAN